MRSLSFVLLVLAALSTTGCEMIGDIFQAGVWVGAVIVVLLIAIIGVMAAKMRG